MTVVGHDASLNRAQMAASILVALLTPNNLPAITDDSADALKAFDKSWLPQIKAAARLADLLDKEVCRR